MTKIKRGSAMVLTAGRLKLAKQQGGKSVKTRSKDRDGGPVLREEKKTNKLGKIRLGSQNHKKREGVKQCKRKAAFRKGP